MLELYRLLWTCLTDADSLFYRFYCEKAFYFVRIFIYLLRFKREFSVKNVLRVFVFLILIRY